MNNVEIDDKMKTDMESSISEMEGVQDVTINLHGKIVYFDIDLVNEATVDEAKNIAIKCLDFFEEEYLNFYDLQFIITKSKVEDSEDVFPILGYKKASATTITWSNNAK